MGRIKTARIKRVTAEIVKKHGKDIKTDFNENKKVLADVAEIRSKKLRNVIAGYATRLARKGKN